MAEKKDTAEKMVKIKLPRLPKNNEPEFVSINERNWMIPRGVEVEVPECVVKVLENAEAMEELAYQYKEAVQK